MLGRLKFELTELVNEMLDQLPKSIFESETSTFLDPCMAGGQFVLGIETRLREYGHSDANIAERVFGVAPRELIVNFAVNKHNLIGHYYVHYNYLEYNEKMKYDVVIGNPPYQSGKGNSDKLWPIFIERSIELAKSDGYVTIVCPDTWTSGTKSVCLTGRKNILSELLLTQNLIEINFDVAKYFPGVGSTFSTFLLQKNTYQSITKIITPNETFDTDLTGYLSLLKNVDKTSLLIAKKVFSSKGETFGFKFVAGLGISYNNHKNQKHSHPFFNASSNHNNCWGDRENGPKFPKIHMRYLGTEFAFDYDIDGKTNVMHNARIWKLPSCKNITKKSCKSVFESMLFQFLVYQNKWGQYNEPRIINQIPVPNLSRIWTDEELYKHFKLTKEEIKYIENAVK